MIAVGIGIDKSSLPVPVGRFVPCGIDPENIIGTRIGCYPPDDSGAVVVIGVVPAHRVVDDVYAVVDAILDSILQIDRVADLHQVEFCLRCHVLDNLGHACTVYFLRFKSVPCVVLGEHDVLKLACSLRGRQAAESQIDDSDLGSLTLQARSVQIGCSA